MDGWMDGRTIFIAGVLITWKYSTIWFKMAKKNYRLHVLLVTQPTLS